MSKMYTQFRELKSNEPFKPEIIENMRENIGKRVPLAVGQSTKDSSIIALVIVDAPEIPWTMAGSPMMILFQNDITGSKRIQGATQRAFKDFPEGDYHLKDLGVDHSNLLSQEFDWGKDYRKVAIFKVSRQENISKIFY